MSRVMQMRWAGRMRRRASAGLRLCAALWMVFYIAYTPIHLYSEEHSDGTDFSRFAPSGDTREFSATKGADGDGNHERHSSAHHKFKVTPPTRAGLVQMLAVPAGQWVDVRKDCPQPQVPDLSGLSPPELPRCWQFLFRAALPVRAPSLLS